MSVAAEVLASEPSLLEQIEVENTREGGIIDAYVPIDLILRTDVPVDEEHVQELTASIREEAKMSRHGQLSPVLLAHIPELNQFVIIDGFHRVASIEPAGLDNVYATIRPNSTWEEVIDLRILTANTHHSVRFARVIEWVEDAWRLSQWCERLSPLQAFSLTQNKAMTGRNLGLSPEEAEAVKQWVQNKCRQWKLSPGAVYQNLNTARVADPELVKEARERRGGRELKYITPQHLKAIAAGLPNQFELQHIAAQVAKDKNLTVRETEGIVMVLATSINSDEAMRLIKSGQWVTFIPEKKKRSASEKAGTSAEDEESMDEVEIHNTADKRTRALTASLKKFAALRKNNEHLTKSVIGGDIDFVRLALENVVLKGKYTAPPLEHHERRHFMQAAGLGYKPEPFPWTKDRINQLTQRADQVRPTIARQLAERQGMAETTVERVINNALQRIVVDIHEGGLHWAEIADQHNFDKLLLRCITSELEQDSGAEVIKFEKPANPVQLTAEKFDRLVQVFEPQPRRAVVMAGIYGLSSFAIAQLIHKRPQTVELGLAELAGQVSSL